MQAKATAVSKEAEEYLKTIYRLENKTGFAKTMEIAHELRVVPGSVTNTVGGLEKRGLVTHRPYRGVNLTEKGRKLALDVLRRHRLAERLLTDILHMDWSEVHEAACKLEHAIPKNIIKPLEKTLRHPKTCPHGNPIPTKCGGIIEKASQSLVNLDSKTDGIIIKIVEEEADILQHLADQGITPGVHVRVEERALSGGSMTVRINGACHILDNKIASLIYVSRL